MTWSLETSRGNESAKIRFDALPYTRGAGLDIGCGPWKAFRHAIGIDGEAAPGVQLVMDGTKLGIFADGVFDFVFSSHFLEHVEDYEAALAEWWRVLKVGGYLILYLPHRDLYPRIGQPGANPDHKHDFEPDDINAAMRRISIAAGTHGAIVENQVRAEGDEYSFFMVARKCGSKEGAKRHYVAALTHNFDPQRGPKGRVAIARPGAYGDSLWASSPAAHLAAQGYEVTVYTEGPGAEILRDDPNIARVVHIAKYQLELGESARYYDHEARKYERFIVLAEAVEKNLLAVDNDLRFYWPDAVRREVFAGNYFDRIHDLAGVPRELRMKFYPSAAEQKEALERREMTLLDSAKHSIAVLVASGSTAPKFWPHLDELSRRLLEAGYAVVILGDLRGWQPEEERISQIVIGEDWPIRDAIAFAQLADLVIGQETAILNAVAMEPMRKVVLLTHSTPENLTRDWVNTATLAGGVPCYPCHRIHQTLAHCITDQKTGAAACQAVISAEAIVRAALRDTPTDHVVKRAYTVIDGGAPASQLGLVGEEGREKRLRDLENFEAAEQVSSSLRAHRPGAVHVIQEPEPAGIFERMKQRFTGARA